MRQRSALNRLKDNLLQLEINTILKDEMTAQPMPALPHALLDIAGNYYNRMVAYRIPAHLFFQTGTRAKDVPSDAVVIGPFDTPPVEGLRPLRVDAETFDRLRWAARVAESKVTDPQRRQILVRIRNNCDTLKAILKSAQPDVAEGPTRTQVADEPAKLDTWVSVDRDDYVTIQKIWDVGTEQVMIQTAISVSGDVNTRIRRSLTPAEQASLLEVHKVAVTVSVTCWQNLVATAVDLMKAGLSVIGRMRGR